MSNVIKTEAFCFRATNDSCEYEGHYKKPEYSGKTLDRASITQGLQEVKTEIKIHFSKRLIGDSEEFLGKDADKIVLTHRTISEIQSRGTELLDRISCALMTFASQQDKEKNLPSGSVTIIAGVSVRQTYTYAPRSDEKSPKQCCILS